MAVNESGFCAGIALVGLGRLGQRPVNRPAVLVNSAPNRSPVNAGYFAPFANRSSLISENEDEVVAPVPAVGFGIGPSAVFRGIRSVVVDAINLVLGRRPRPHVGNKVIERCPAFAHFYSSAAVHGVARVARIFASLVDAFPYRVFGHIKECGTRPAWRLHLADARAPARRCVAADEIVVTHDAHRAAITNAFPRASAYPCRRHNNQLAKAHAGNIFDRAIPRIHAHMKESSYG